MVVAVEVIVVIVAAIMALSITHLVVLILVTL